MTQEPTFRCPNCDLGFYKTLDAASYLEMKLSTLKYHFHVAKNIKPLVDVERRLALFTRQALDEFQATRRKPGRPCTVRPGQCHALRREVKSNGLDD